MAFLYDRRAGWSVFVQGFPNRMLSAGRELLRLAPSAFPYVFWTVVSIGLGLFFGLASVILPPTGAFGIVAAAGVVLLWAVPDLPHAPVKAVRVTFFMMLVLVLTIPTYYAFVVPGLPWISVRRFATFALIIPFVIAIAGSSAERKKTLSIFLDSSLLSSFTIGFLIMNVISTVTSKDAVPKQLPDERDHPGLVYTLLRDDLFGEIKRRRFARDEDHRLCSNYHLCHRLLRYVVRESSLS